jgi:hypothetical protein
MKHAFITTSLTIGSVALFLVLDVLFWHRFGLDWRKNLYWQSYRDWFWLGFGFYAFGFTFRCLERARTLEKQQIAHTVHLVLHIGHQLYPVICMVCKTLSPEAPKPV